MARLINNKTNYQLYASVYTIYEDGSETVRKFGVGDIIEGLRYVEDGEIVTVNGKITAINYTMNSKLTWNKNKPADTIATDMKLTNMVVDCSERYNAKSVTIPFVEILEDEGIENVTRIKFTPSIKFSLQMYFSNRSTQYAEIEVGDTFNNVRIMNPNDIGNDYTGAYKCIGFAYRTTGGKLNITGIAFQNIEDDSIVVTDINYIFGLNEVYTYVPESAAEVQEMFNNAADGDTIKIDSELVIAGQPLVFDGKSVTLNLSDGGLSADSSADSQILIKNGTVTIEGDAPVKFNTPYDSTHSTNGLKVTEGGKLVINNMNMNAVAADTPEGTVDAGQYGIGVEGNGELIVNGGNYEAGWFCVNTHGTQTGTDASITINDGKFVSLSDYVIYMAANTLTTINGGEFVGGAGALSMNNGRTRINGGYFHVTNLGNTGEGSDGTTGQANSLFNLNAKYGDCKLGIYGGTFNVEGDAPMFRTGTKHTAEIKIFGGKFNVKPDTTYLAEGYVCSEEADVDGYYRVYNENGLGTPLGEWP